MPKTPRGTSRHRRREGGLIYVSRLELTNFRNYEGLQLDLPPGMVLLYGSNGQGKTNILEAIYLLAVVKSPRASSDRDLVRREALERGEHAQVSAVVQRDGVPLRVVIGLQRAAAVDASATEGATEPVGGAIQKQVRVNGAPRRVSDLVGEVNAVLFTAQDMGIVLGPPSSRRRYVDILISQVDNRYLRLLQKYQQVMAQRNQLLKAVRDGRSQPAELEFWDGELVESGAYIMQWRASTISAVAELAAPLHEELSGGTEKLRIVYRPSVGSDADEQELGGAMRAALERSRPREIAQGFTAVGPHRDDLLMLLDGLDAGSTASRGQCRTMVLALKLAEASFLRDERGQEPVLLLDDILSELDAKRRARVLDRAGLYQQCLITAATLESVDRKFIDRMSKFSVADGKVSPFESAPAPS